ncbi:hypothetical protein FQN55_001820 [Onygenales sp. PD_40]|nr:hypothetical protein FQN55_001820 [Onygenales sp. PD_40]KAK2790531.1 hypothetical protein FQN52_005548 [Onygenales sp. PD_12]
MSPACSAQVEQHKAIIDWLAACEACPSSSTDEIPGSSSRQRRRNPSRSCRSASYNTFRRPGPTLALAPVMDDSNNEANRGRGKNRVTTRSRGRKDGPRDRSKVGVGGSLTNAPIGLRSAEDASPEQLGEPISAVSSELAAQTPTTLSRTPAFTATSISLKDSSSRSRSPTKTMGDLRAARPPIKLGTMREAPEAIRELRNKFKFNNICGGIGVLPHSLKTQLNEIDDDEYHSLFFDDRTSSAISDDLEVFQKLHSIQNAASKCDMLMKPEPSWGEEVFRPMLSLAAELENRESEQEVQVENVTTTQIFPGSLVPAGLQNLPFTSKRVDYCIYLSQTDPQETHTRDILAMRDIDIDNHSINQAGSSDYIKWLPQLAAVECKKTPSGTEGTVQLGIWMAALLKRLEGLMEQGVHLKPMPCLKVEGLGWKMYWCCVGDKGETMLYGPIALGLMENMKGMYQILNALRAIVKYGRDDYWPWFRETILWKS